MAFVMTENCHIPIYLHNDIDITCISVYNVYRLHVYLHNT